MGRLDRFGTGDPVRSVVIVDTGNPAESAWLQFLNEGLEVFDQSMASLQYLVEESGRELVIQWLGEGVQALMDKTARLTGPQGLVVRERQRIEQQDMLDSLCEPPTAAFDTLERVDGEWRSWSESFNRFAVDALQLSQRSVAWEGVLDPGNQVFRMGYSLGAGRPTLISLPSFIQEFRDSIDKEADGFHYRNPLTSAYSFKRSTCRTKEGRRLGVRPLRYGDEFVRGLVSFCETDDRGRSFAMWRNFPKYQNVDGCGADLYFRFDFLVEANIDTESSREFGPESFRILRRRADGYLPPEYVSVWVSADGVASENAPEEARLPYRPKTQEGMEGRDFNLNPTRWKALHSQSRFPWLREWPELCAIARRSAQVYVESLPRVRELITSGLQASRQQHIVRQAQVSSRISRLNGVARIAEEQELEKEEKLQALLGSALVKPSLKLDVAGAVFLSSRFGFRS
jgi:ATP-dependent helicase HepA